MTLSEISKKEFAQTLFLLHFRLENDLCNSILIVISVIVRIGRRFLRSFVHFLHFLVASWNGIFRKTTK